MNLLPLLHTCTPLRSVNTKPIQQTNNSRPTSLYQPLSSCTYVCYVNVIHYHGHKQQLWYRWLVVKRHWAYYGLCTPPTWTRQNCLVSSRRRVNKLLKVQLHLLHMTSFKEFCLNLWWPGNNRLFKAEGCSLLLYTTCYASTTVRFLSTPDRSANPAQHHRRPIISCDCRTCMEQSSYQRHSINLFAICQETT